MNILFTGAGRRVELIQSFREAALCLDKELKIYGADRDGTAPALKFCDFTRIVCGMRDKNYIADLAEICEKDSINMVIPTIDTDLLVLSENREKFEAIGTKVLVSSPERIKVCRDKNYTSQFFMDCGLEAPVPVNNWKEYKDSYPAFIKPKDGSSSINAYKAGNKGELEVYASQVKDYVIQPFINGTEYTVDIFCDFEGNPVYITPRIRLAVRAGEVLKTQIDLDETIIKECKKLIRAFRPCGPITVQLIREAKSGTDYYIEINPRFGGGAPLSMKAGAKSAESILKLLGGEKESYSNEKVNDGAVYSRFDWSVCVKEGRNPQIRGVIFDLDDTLYPEKEYVRSGYRAVAEYLGAEYLAEKLWDYFEQGKPAIDECLKSVGRLELKEECLRVYRSHKPNIHLYEGVPELMEKLKAGGIRTGIITDGRPEGQRNKIEALGLVEMVDDIIITDELGGTQFRKPCDISFRIMQKRWRKPFEALLYVGDNPAKDFQAAKQLGIKSVWFRNKDGLYDRDCFGDLEINNSITNIEEIVSYLKF